MSWLFWLLVGFGIEWAIEMWYWRERRIGRFTEPLEARVKELEEELRRAQVVTAAGRGATTSSSRAGATSAATAPKATASKTTAPTAQADAADDGPAAIAAEPDAAPDVPIVTSRRSTRRDDLLRIKGIGEVFQDRLYEAGVTTYDALAAKSAEEVAAIIKPEEWQNYDFFAWIREADALANKR